MTASSAPSPRRTEFGDSGVATLTVGVTGGNVVEELHHGIPIRDRAHHGSLGVQVTLRALVINFSASGRTAWARGRVVVTFSWRKSRWRDWP